MSGWCDQSTAASHNSSGSSQCELSLSDTLRSEPALLANSKERHNEAGLMTKATRMIRTILSRQKRGVVGYDRRKVRVLSRLKRHQSASANDPQQCLKTSCSVVTFRRP